MDYSIYIPSLAFAWTTIIGVYISNLLFKAGKGWARSPLVGQKFLNEKEGYVAFLVSIMVGSVASVIAEPYITSFLGQNSTNVLLFFGAFIVMSIIYYRANYLR